MTYTKLVNGEPVMMSAEETTARQAEEAAWLSERVSKQNAEQNKSAVLSKWPDLYTFINDLLDRGIDALKTDRDNLIK